MLMAKRFVGSQQPLYALQGASRGLDSVEEMDPVERMRLRYGIGSEQAGTGTARAQVSGQREWHCGSADFPLPVRAAIGQQQQGIDS
jgi:hypothetical protein